MKKLYLITELCESGELAKWIKKRGPVPEHESRVIMKQIVEAISYLHKHDIVHRDLKLENILIKEFDFNTENFFVKVNIIFQFYIKISSFINRFVFELISERLLILVLVVSELQQVLNPCSRTIVEHLFIWVNYFLKIKIKITQIIKYFFLIDKFKHQKLLIIIRIVNYVMCGLSVS